MRISDWSSDVCSSDLMRVSAKGHHRVGMLEHRLRHVRVQVQAGNNGKCRAADFSDAPDQLAFGVVERLGNGGAVQIGRASGWARVLQDVETSGGAVKLQ